MPINLRDITDAVKFYLDNKVSVVVTSPDPVGTQIDPNEAFTFSVKATNAPVASGGVALKNVHWQVSIANQAVAKFRVPPATAGSAKDANGNAIAAGTLVGFMVFTPIIGSDLKGLNTGETDTLQLNARAGSAPGGGITQISAQIGADINLDKLFPLGENSILTSTTLTVNG